uniref:Uncharacterized protein n=1 Tax=Rhizophora mucronata TaxID=61149 RepID=A0A2P2NNQ9_RHIMU
MRLGPRGS